MKISAVAYIDEHVIAVGEWCLTDPIGALGTLMGKGFSLAVPSRWPCSGSQCRLLPWIRQEPLSMSCVRATGAEIGDACDICI